MSASVHTGGATHALAAISVRDASNALHSVAIGKVRDATSLGVFFGSLSVSLSTDTVGGRVNSSLSVAISTYAVAAIPTGGAEPYTYLWTRTDGAPGTWTINSPSSEGTTFTGGNCGPGEELSATFHCTVTDAAGIVAVTSDVTATVRNIGYNVSSGGGPLP